VNPSGVEQVTLYTARGLTSKVSRKHGGQEFGHTLYEYDDYGNEIRRTSSVDSDGDGTPDTQTVAYDGHSQARQLQDGVGRVHEAVYNHSGQLIEVLSKWGGQPFRRFTFTRDALGRAIAVSDRPYVIEYDGTPGPPVDETVTEYGYGLDPAVEHWVSQTTAGASRLYRFVHDSAGRRTGILVGDGTELSVVDQLDAGGRITARTVRRRAGSNGDGVPSPATATWQYGYNPFGHLRSVIDPEGIENKYSFTADGLIRYHLAPGQTGTEYLYRSDGVLTRMSQESLVSPQTRTRQVSYTYFGAPVAETDFDNKTTTNAYDDLGRIEAKLLADGTQVTYSHDELDRLIGSATAGGASTTLLHDADGRLRSLVASKVGSTVQRTIVRAPHGEARQVTESVTGRPEVVTRFKTRSDGVLLGQTCQWGSATRKIDFGRDGFGEITSIQYPSGASYALERDPMGRLSRISKASGQEVVDLDGLYGFSKWRSALIGQARVRSNEFDGSNRTTALAEGPAGGPATTAKSYLYTANGNMDRAIDLVSQKEDRFYFDAFHRLTQWKHQPLGGAALRTVDWVHDMADNPDSQVDTLAPSLAFVTNLLHQTTSALPVVGSIAYDPDGWAIAKNESTRSLAWQRDALGRPLSLQVSTNGGGQASVEFTYDGMDQLVATSSAPGVLMEYLFVGDNLYGHSAPWGGWVDLIWGDSNGDLLARHSDATGTDAFVGDGLGNIIALTDQSGVLESYALDPYGLPRSSPTGAALPSTSAGNPLVFQTRPYLWGTGVSLLGARELDAELGVFLGRDPLAGAVSDNPYGYAGRNPMRWHDRTGRSKESLGQDQQPLNLQQLLGEDKQFFTGPKGMFYELLEMVMSTNMGELGITKTKYKDLTISEQQKVVEFAIEGTTWKQDHTLDPDAYSAASNGLKELKKEQDILKKFANGSLYEKGTLYLSNTFSKLTGEPLADTYIVMDAALDMGGTLLSATFPMPGPVGPGKWVAGGVKKAWKALKAGTKSANIGKAAKGGARSVDDLVKAAQSKFPGKAGKIEQHHVTPKYLGGDPKGPTVPIDAAYHQEITNAFREAWPYGQGAPSPADLQRIMNDYSRFPLPGGQ
jgi:RHS repeat-associated protein